MSLGCRDPRSDAFARIGAGKRNRTFTVSPPPDFESGRRVLNRPIASMKVPNGARRRNENPLSLYIFRWLGGRTQKAGAPQEVRREIVGHSSGNVHTCTPSMELGGY